MRSEIENISGGEQMEKANFSSRLRKTEVNLAGGREIERGVRGRKEEGGGRREEGGEGREDGGGRRQEGGGRW